MKQMRVHKYSILASHATDVIRETVAFSTDDKLTNQHVLQSKKNNGIKKLYWQ